MIGNIYKVFYYLIIMKVQQHTLTHDEDKLSGYVWLDSRLCSTSPFSLSPSSPRRDIILGRKNCGVILRTKSLGIYPISSTVKRVMKDFSYSPLLLRDYDDTIILLGHNSRIPLVRRNILVYDNEVLQ